MKLIALSDIHGNLAAVQQLRAQETNSFDAVIVAGDIGHDSAKQVLEIFASFCCPVFYVYGNHDHALQYDQNFGDDCHHLHMRAICHGHLRICGFSGCSVSWGENPIALRIEAEARQIYRDIFVACEEAENALEAARQDYEAEKAACEEVISDALSKLAAKERAKGVDRRSSGYRKKVERCHSRVYKSYTKTHASYRESEAAFWKSHGALSALKNTPRHEHYLSHLHSSYKFIIKQNRNELSNIVSSAKATDELLVIVTHERLTRTSEDFPIGTLFLFGHLHRFSDTVFHGSRFVNVSALDNSVVFRPKHLDKFEWEDCKVVQAGTYAVITSSKSGEMEIKRMSLNLPNENWVAVRDREYVYGANMQPVRFSVY